MDEKSENNNMENQLGEILGSVQGIEEAVTRDLHTDNGGQGFVITDTKGIKDATMRVKEYNSSFVGDLSLATDIYHGATRLATSA